MSNGVAGKHRDHPFQNVLLCQAGFVMLLGLLAAQLPPSAYLAKFAAMCKRDCRRLHLMYGLA